MIVSSIPWMDDGTPTPNRKKKKFLPFPLTPKPKKREKLAALIAYRAFLRLKMGSTGKIHAH
jgi:hypothetical protein